MSDPSEPLQPAARQLADRVQVLAFDIFGTVVDWHGSIVREMRALHPNVDGAAFARAWRAGYAPAMARVMRGEQPWTLIDALHRDVSDSTLSIYYDAVDGCSREMENEDQEMMVREYYLHDGWAAKHGTGA